MDAAADNAPVWVAFVEKPLDEVDTARNTDTNSCNWSLNYDHDLRGHKIPCGDCQYKGYHRCGEKW